MRTLIATAALCLAAAPTFAASPKIEAAVKTFKSVAADTGKVQTFCEMTKVMNAAGDTVDAAAQAKVDGYMKQLGPDFEAAWNTGGDVDENSADGKALNAALDELAAKCPT
jgi:hypothetical protein